MVLPRTSIINDALERPTGTNGPLPSISTDLETIRAYQFEVNFQGFPGITTNQNSDGNVTVAAKQVGTISYGVEPLALDRLNDKVHYPGKVTYEPVEITFDNLLLKNSTEALWQTFKEVYSPITGKSGYRSSSGQRYKGDKLTIVEMNGDNVPVGGVELYGVYPEKVVFSEKNYSNNEFSTVTVTFRFDFMNYARRPGFNGAQAGSFQGGGQGSTSRPQP